jgi:invasion protein IalB
MTKLMKKLMNGKTVFAGLFLVAAAVAVLGSGAFAEDKAAAAKLAAADKGNDVFWTVRCEKGFEKDLKSGKCEVFQRLIVKETNQRMVEFAVGFPEKKDTARGVIVMPLGVLLTEQVTLQIDKNKSFAFDVRYCTGDGCFAYVNLTKEVLDTMRSGQKAVLSFRTMEGRQVNVELSLKDFGKALKQVQTS